ncbi:MAG: TolC family protein [Desulfuromonadales bacterium]|nr:TolC family protein [Desulfuromonadales bacterium]
MACLALSGCGSQPVSLDRMSSALAQELDRAPARKSDFTRVAIDISEGMVPAITAAVNGHEAYRSALFAERDALGGIGVATSVRRPQLSGSATLGLVREDGAGQSDTTTGAAGGINLSQILYDGGESTAGVNRATAAALMARAEREARGNDLALQAASAWIDVWQYSERLHYLQTRVSELQTVLAQIERMATSGMLDRSVVDSARRELVTLALEETRLITDLAEARVRYDRFFRGKVLQLERPAPVVTTNQALDLAADWRRAPRLERSAAELVVARSELASANAAFGPRARLQAGVTSPLEQSESTDSSVGLVLDYAFSDGGLRQSQRRAAVARVASAEAGLADARLSLQSELEVAVARLLSIDRSLELLREKVELTASEVQTARSQIVTGQASLRQLIDTELEGLRAVDQRFATYADQLKLQLTIASLTGALGDLIGLSEVL